MEKVLIIDDEPGILELMGEYLGRNGLEVVTADNGEAGIRVLAQDRSVSAVVLDIRMPGTDGVTVFSRIRADRPEVPVIILTGSVGAEIKDMGAEGVFMKPVDMEKLLGRIKELIDR